MHHEADSAAAEIIEHLGGTGAETLFDRFESQRPQCRHGLDARCCRMCQWGPCRITPSTPRGVCGRDLSLVGASTLARAVAAGTSAQTMHARELVLTLRAIAHGEISLDIKSANRLREAGNALSATVVWTPAADAPALVAEAMLEDISRVTDERMRALGFAPRERRDVWESLGLSPRSAAYEVLESLHMTTLGGCSDWREIVDQSFRTALAYAYSGLIVSSVLSDVLFGVPEPTSAVVNFAVLKPGHVNILVHGHSAVMLEKVLECVSRPETLEAARAAGAEDIVVAGMCCTGHESLARHGVPTVSGAIGQELAIGTGAVDAVVVDMQCVIPGIRGVAECFGTEIITTCNSNRIPEATHIPFDPEHPETLDADAARVVGHAIAAFQRRNHDSVVLPGGSVHVMTGFSREAILKAFGLRRLLALMEEGSIRGVAAMVGCSSPKLGYEGGHTALARELIANGVLVLASGCSAHALLNAGLCSLEAAEFASPGLREACEEAGVPPVLVVGGCADNARILQVFAMLANQQAEPLPAMPFAVCGPEFANEKTAGQMMAVLAHGIAVAVGASPNLPIPRTGSTDDIPDDALELFRFFAGEGLRQMTGGTLIVEPDPVEAARSVIAEIDSRRAGLGWADVATL